MGLRKIAACGAILVCVSAASMKYADEAKGLRYNLKFGDNPIVADGYPTPANLELRSQLNDDKTVTTYICDRKTGASRIVRNGMLTISEDEINEKVASDIKGGKNVDSILATL